ncbi:TetR/AcrR family transcriptional regulator [Streptomyces paludis]|uniref:TetR/AcrR family transcriptional regulator n=1 Tax=Streptomyces paludis TaxID=2282738 RepID=A0A345HSL2_9ACTN|nr:TetR/AcrR family transcriptional regulator [Streptomyces paludis]AXG79686.1 TetR/AcrR family transcriptional regulator [Streptomyces paludis]
MPTAAEHVPEPRTAPPSLRQRRRAVAVQEIVDAAERHLAEHGPAALSLRAVARDLGMTVQALYHYFPSRNALVTVLITKGYDDLTEAVRAAVDAVAGDTAPGDSVAVVTATGDTAVLPRFVVAALGYRQWAVDHPERFQLLYGTPLRSYEAPAEGPTTQATRRMGALFQNELFAGRTTAQLAAAGPFTLSPPLRSHLERLSPQGPDALPPAAASLFLSAWGHLHGLVTLEVFGHTAFIGSHQAEIFQTSMLTMLEDIHHRIPGPAGPTGR